MKKQNEISIFHTKQYAEITARKKLGYPFEPSMMQLLKEENMFEQEYYLAERGEEYAFYVIYKMRMNIFTFGRFKCMMNLKVVGYPCSLSEPGFVTNSPKLLFACIKKQKGAVLVLNSPLTRGRQEYGGVPEPYPVKGMLKGETLPTCMFRNHYASVDEYMSCLRSPYRRRLRKAVQACEQNDIRVINLENTCGIEKSDMTAELRAAVYRMYLNTYEKSDYKLEKMEQGFFERVDGECLVFLLNEKAYGFVLLKKVNEHLVFMLCGMDYSRKTADLYYYMLLTIIRFAIENKCKTIDFGQTSEQTKLKFGAYLEPRYFYAHHSNPVLNVIAGLGSSLLAYHYHFPDYHCMKDTE